MNKVFRFIIVCAFLIGSAYKLSAQSEINATINGGLNTGTLFTYPNFDVFYTSAGVYQFGLKYEYRICEKMALHAGLDIVSKSRVFHSHSGIFVTPPLTQYSYDYLGLVSYKSNLKNEFRLGGYFQNVFKAEEYNTTEQAMGLRFQYNYLFLKHFNTGVVIYTDITPSRINLDLLFYHIGLMFELEYKLFEFKHK